MKMKMKILVSAATLVAVALVISMVTGAVQLSDEPEEPSIESGLTLPLPDPTEPIPPLEIPGADEVETEDTTVPPEATESIEPSPEELLWLQRAEEYPVATEIWTIMKSYGWSDAACAGILGNIMREVGGDTLEYIDPDLYGYKGNYYGLCQWSITYYPEIFPSNGWTPSIQEQLDFLRYTIVNYNGHGFSYGFTEDYLMTATDCKEVARKFCNGYERPNEPSTRRENNAENAYNYFTSEG